MMRQLEKALELLAQRAESLPTDLLVERLEAQLSEERQLSGDATPGAATDLDDVIAVSRLARWRGPMIAVGTAAAIVAVVAAATLLLRGDRADVVDEPADEPNPVTTTMPTYVFPESSVPTPIDEIHGLAVAGETLWASTGAGIVRWDLETREATLFTPGDDLPFAEGASGLVAVAPDGTVWASTWNGDIARFDGIRWSEPADYDQFETVNSPCIVGEDCENPITAIAVGPDGHLSLAVGPETLLQYDGVDWDVVPVTPAETLPDGVSAWTGSMAIAADGTLWAASREELLEYDGAGWTRHTVDTGLPSEGVAVAPNGDIWAGTADLERGGSGGVTRFDGNSWTGFDETDGLYESSVTTIAVGPDGTIWTVHGALEETGLAESPASGGVSWFDGASWSSTTIADVGFGFGWGNAVVDDTGTLWTTSFWGVVGFDGIEKTVLRVPEGIRPEAPHVIEGGTTPPPAAWDQILATTTARPAPTPAVCPAGTDPKAPGPIDQARPSTDGGGNQSTVFDRHTGRIVHVTAGAIWTFDVCTNTWERMNPSGSPDEIPVGHLVYDVDSDRVVSVGQSSWVYDAGANSWSSISNPVEVPSDNWWWAVGGVVYDPVSGLILAQHDEYGVDKAVLSAYDVETDQWTRVGLLDDSTWRNLIGYSPQIDRLIFAGYRGGFSGYAEGLPLVVDPRTGAGTQTGRGPDISGGFSILNYATDTPTAYVQTRPSEEICWFDPTTLTWDGCFPVSGYPGDVRERYFAAMVGDPLNSRLVVVHPQVGWDQASDRMGTDVGAVWAIELDTAQWIELLAPPSP